MSLATAPPMRPESRAEPEALPCRQFDPDMWFSESPAELELAKSLCGGCPLRLECLSGAVTRAEPWGVWGGEIFEAGRVVARKRPRGRPRKDDTTRESQLRDEAAARAARALAAMGAATEPTVRLAA